ncbi:MAG: exodeoxyribonuclease VII large subunit, partial [Alphaproteobacteria bacterium]|nr:exodeoxyribonuclease VII large subunit [Alphaproteobacteria bacterium]
ELARRRELWRATAGRLERIRPQIMLRLRERLGVMDARLKAAMTSRAANARERIEAQRKRLNDLQARLRKALGDGVQRARLRLVSLEQLRQSLGYRNVLARGFALVRDDASRPLRMAAGITPGAAIQIEFADGSVDAVTAGGSSPPAQAVQKPSPKPASRPPGRSGGQGTLF